MCDTWFPKHWLIDYKILYKIEIRNYTLFPFKI